MGRMAPTPTIISVSGLLVVVCGDDGNVVQMVVVVEQVMHIWVVIVSEQYCEQSLHFLNLFKALLYYVVAYAEDDFDFNDFDNAISSGEGNLEFDKNVTEGIELGCDGGATEQDEDDYAGMEHNEDQEADDLECPSFEELLLAISSDDEVGYRFPEFSSEMDIRDPYFQIGQLFSSVKEFRKAIRTYSAVNGYNVKCKVNDERRVQGTCKAECKWRIWVSKINNLDTVQMKSYIPEHTCSRDQYNHHCTYTLIVNRYFEQFKADPEWKMESMQTTVKEDLKINITRNVAWKARRYAKQMINGTIEEQFVGLRSYAAEVLRSNPGSTCLQEGFQLGCRKIIRVDGCHLHIVWGGILLTVVGLDVNDCIYPIAYAVVEKENTIALRWFLRYLAEDIHMGNGTDWTVMTDRQKGLSNVIDELFPTIEHSFCVRHMYTNFFSMGFKGRSLKDFLWRDAKSTTVADYRQWMQ
ncbi:uncharacterized protein LOC111412673 [Olea europaea var. sylvestris]|uniref:uncharacterized protein LOC111412673 n=1 Tax=Olea europaea var. sylvestris TaxID=158386 RepID=UPI000C1D89F2|nr:uncharacterized protein LOC111412673 [Olea europaea var. sylvestris]